MNRNPRPQYSSRPPTGGVGRHPINNKTDINALSIHLESRTCSGKASGAVRRAGAGGRGRLMAISAGSCAKALGHEPPCGAERRGECHTGGIRSAGLRPRAAGDPGPREASEGQQWLGPSPSAGLPSTLEGPGRGQRLWMAPPWTRRGSVAPGHPCRAAGWEADRTGVRGACFQGPGPLCWPRFWQMSLKLGPSDPLPRNILHQAPRALGHQGRPTAGWHHPPGSLRALQTCTHAPVHLYTCTCAHIPRSCTPSHLPFEQGVETGCPHGTANS